MNDLIVFNPLYKNEDVKICFELYNEIIKNNNLDYANSFVSLLIRLAEKYNLYGNLFNSLLTNLLINNENSFSLALERKHDIAINLKDIVINDFKIIFKMFNTDFSCLTLLQQNLINNFVPSKPVINQELFDISRSYKIV